MNSCRKGLADRTWSVTRWLWRDRYTLSCLQENNYMQCALQTQSKAPNHFIHLCLLFLHLLSPFQHHFHIYHFLCHYIENIHLSSHLPSILLLICFFVRSLEQRPQEQSGPSRGFPEIQQRRPGGSAGAPHSGAGGAASG